MSRKVWWVRIGAGLMKKGRLVNNLEKWCANKKPIAHPARATFLFYLTQVLIDELQHPICLRGFLCSNCPSKMESNR